MMNAEKNKRGRSAALVFLSAILFLLACLWVVLSGKGSLERERRDAAAEWLSQYSYCREAEGNCSDMLKQITQYEEMQDNLVEGNLEQVYELYGEKEELEGLAVITSVSSGFGESFFAMTVFDGQGRIAHVTLLPGTRYADAGRSVGEERFLTQFLGVYVNYFAYQTSNVVESTHVINAADDLKATEAVVSAVNLAVYCRDMYYPQLAPEEVFYEK